MTSATRPVGAPGSSATLDRRETQPAILTSVPSGWYDPDGAAWEAEAPPPASEVLRTTPVRPSIRVEVADPSEN